MEGGANPFSQREKVQDEGEARAPEQARPRPSRAYPPSRAPWLAFKALTWCNCK